jgi:hypothetical protein
LFWPNSKEVEKLKNIKICILKIDESLGFLVDITSLINIWTD